MDLKQIKELITSLEGSKLKKISLKKGDFELHLEKESEAVATIATLPPSYQPQRTQISQSVEAVAIEQKQAAPGKFVTSPMVGTYYSSPAPDQPVFLKVGDRVEENTIVCIVEAMKVMNEVKAGVSGTVAELFLDNAHPVEFGTRIIRVV